MELTNAERAKLVALRGGCSCHIAPPCGQCTEPPTVAELAAIGITPERMVASDLVGHCKEVKILESGGVVGPLLLDLCAMHRLVLDRACACVASAAMDFVIRAHRE